MDPLKKSHKIKQIIRIKVTSIPSQAIHISKYFHPQSFFIYALSLLTIICLQGCEKKENPLMIYKDKCQNDLNVVG